MEKLAKDYFNLMISKGSIPQNWNYDSSITKDNSTTIYFTHSNGKRSSFRILNDSIKSEVREWKLRQLLN